MFPLLLLLVCINLSSVTARQVARKAAGIDTHVIRLTTSYMSNAQLSQYVYEFAKRCSDIAKVHNLGDSPAGTPMLSLELSAQPGVDSGKPMVKYVGNIHGDEPSGRQLLLLLAEQICTEYKQAGSPGHELMQRVRLFLLPTVNPDGFSQRSRSNMNQVDLNRNFPDHIKSPDTDLKLPTQAQQPETLLIMNYTLSNRFVASLALHEGAVVANYPYDGYPDGSLAATKMQHPCPDDSTFVMLATWYSKLHTTMHSNREFAGGITNGAEWYPLYGGMQDWNYLAAGCMEVTLELNNDKWPSPHRLRAMWQENQVAMMTWPLKVVFAGVHGTVQAAGPDGTLQPIEAVIKVGNSPVTVKSSPTNGAYYRILAPGTYKVYVMAEGYKMGIAQVEIPEGSDGLTRDWVLQADVKPGATTPANPEPAPQPKVPAETDGDGAEEHETHTSQDRPGQEKEEDVEQKQEKKEDEKGQGGDTRVPDTAGDDDDAGQGKQAPVLDTRVDTSSQVLELPVQERSSVLPVVLVFIVIPALIGGAFLLWRRLKPSYTQQGYAQVQVIAVGTGARMSGAGSRIGRPAVAEV